VVPYILYRGKFMWSSWARDGPKGAVYAVNERGWMTIFNFSQWFKECFLPVAKRKEGPVLLVGDNHSSHLGPEVIQLCRENNIRFVCLPPNATDKMQPLDVGFFKTVKSLWKKMLRKYLTQDPSAKLLQKTIFPSMLKVPVVLQSKKIGTGTIHGKLKNSKLREKTFKKLLKTF